MALIEGMRGGPGGVQAARRVGGRRRDGFAPDGIALSESPEAASLAPTGPLMGLDGLLTLQEGEAGAVADRQGRRHGAVVLNRLAALQLAMLHPDGVASGDLARLSALCDAMPVAADAALRGLLQSIALRARIELARRA